MKKSKKQKREEAQQRQQAYEALTIEEKITKAQTAKGQSTKQLARLLQSRSKCNTSKTEK